MIQREDAIHYNHLLPSFTSITQIQIKIIIKSLKIHLNKTLFEHKFECKLNKLFCSFVRKKENKRKNFGKLGTEIMHM